MLDCVAVQESREATQGWIERFRNWMEGKEKSKWALVDADKVAQQLHDALQDVVYFKSNYRP